MMDIRQLVLELGKKGIRIFLDQDALKIISKSGQVDPEDLSLLKQYKNDIKDYLSKFKNDEIEKIAIQPFYKCSSAQQRMWILNQIDLNSAAYHIAGTYLFEGELDVQKLNNSFFLLIDRHEALRTIFEESTDGGVNQIVLERKDLNFNVAYEDLQKEPFAENLLKDRLNKQINVPFDLSKGPLLRVSLYKIKLNKWVFNITMHHIISDGWSMNILIEELFLFYNSISSVVQNKDILPPLRIQYKDYTAWHRKQIESKEVNEHRKYWLEKFSGNPTVLHLPHDYKRQSVSKQKGATVRRQIKTGPVEQLKTLVKNEGATLFMGLLSIVKLLLHKYTSLEDIIVGSPIAGREHTELQNQIGLYLNTIALRTKFKSDESFIDLLKKVKQTTLESQDHQLYPFDQLIEDLKLKREINRNPLFDVMVVLQNTRNFKNVVLNIDNLKISGYKGEADQTSKFDLHFEFFEQEGYLQIKLEYNGEIFSEERIESIIDHFELLLDEAIKFPKQQIQDLNYLSDIERQKVLFDFNDTAVNYTKDKTIIDLFEEQVKRAPENIAVIYGSRKLTFKELNEKSNQLGAYLRETYNIRPNELVGVKLERSEDMIVAIVGILKSGAAYVPMDMDYPKDRIDYMTKDSQCKVVIDTGVLMEFNKVEEKYSKQNIAKINQSLDLVYVIYTSGTTGNPKGVMVENRSLINRLEWMQKSYMLTAEDVILQKTSYSFDVSVWELFWWLIKGAKLCVLNPGGHQDPKDIIDHIETHKVSVLHFVPSMLSLFLEYIRTNKIQNTQLGSLKQVYASGEALTVEQNKHFFEQFKHVSLMNLYGPTEATIDVTYFECSKGLTCVPIGKPISNTQMYVLNDFLQPVAIGVQGKIFISGVGVARGYLNKPELTAEKFILNPFIEGERMYDSGDLGRWLSDGTIEYLGRKDHQVKIRGYRIELGEIENALTNNEAVESAVVLVKDSILGDKELIAYIVNRKDKEVNTHDLHSYLSKFLPSFMLPSGYVKVDSIPLSSNGKIDKKALGTIEGAYLKSGVTFIAARTVIEQNIVNIWEEVLNKKNIGIKNNFFELGGDSIKSIQIAARLKQKGFLLSVQDVLRSVNIEELALYVKTAYRMVDQSPVAGEIPLSPIQSRYFEQTTIDHHHYNQSVLLYCAAGISVEGLEKILEKLYEHHDVLRMVYHRDDQLVWHQVNKELGVKPGLEVFDYVDKQTFVINVRKVQASFDLESGVLFKAFLFRDHETDKILLVSHHLIIDGISWRVLLEDISSLYEQYLAKLPLNLPLKTDSFKYWQEKLIEYSNGETMQTELQYWKSIDAQQIDMISMDFTAGSNLYEDKDSKRFQLTEEQTKNLQTKCYKTYRTEINDILLAALSLAMNNAFGINNLLINLEGHGREEIAEIDISRTIGWFTIIYPVLLSVKDTDKINHLISVKENLHRIPQKGIGYGISRYLLKELYQHEAQVTFNYLGDFGGKSDIAADSKRFRFSSDFNENQVSGNRQRETVLDFSGIIIDDKLSITVSYSNKQFKPTTIDNLVSNFKQNLIELIDVLSADKEEKMTPVDFTFKGLSVNDLTKLTSKLTSKLNS